MTDGCDPRDRESVLRDLCGSDEDLRRLAVERLEVLPEAERLTRLVHCLGDPDWRVRKAAVARVVAQSDPVATARALIQALADGDNPGRRNSAVEALVALGPSVTPELIEACGDPDDDVRKFAVDSLAGIGDELAVPRLIQCLEDPDPNVCAAAADALGAIGGDAASAALIEVATDASQDTLVKFSALHALDTLEAPLGAGELAGVLDDPMLGPAALGLLGRCEGDPGAADALLKGLESPTRAARESAIRGVLRWVAHCEGPELEDFLDRVRNAAASQPALVESAVERLADAELGTQLAQVQFLGICADTSVVLPLLRACRDEALAQVALTTLQGFACAATLDAHWDELSAEDRRHACAVLGGGCEAGAVPRLVSALEDADVEVRTAAAQALGELGDLSALEPLVGRLESIDPSAELDDADERESVVVALSRLVAPAEDGTPHPGCARAVDLLSALWSGAGESARLSVAQIMGRIARPEDGEQISLLLMDPSASVRCAAIGAFSRLESGRAVEPLHLAVADESPEVRLAAARALEACREDWCFEDLRNLCSDEDDRVRAAAVSAIALGHGRSEDAERRAATQELMQRAYADTVPVALAVVEALNEGGRETSRQLLPLLVRQEPEVVREAVRCFGRTAEAEDLERLFHLVSHPEWSVRAEVVEVLAERRARQAVPAILRRMEMEQDDFVRKVILSALATLEG